MRATDNRWFPDDGGHESVQDVEGVFEGGLEVELDVV